MNNTVPPLFEEGWLELRRFSRLNFAPFSEKQKFSFQNLMHVLKMYINSLKESIYGVFFIQKKQYNRRISTRKVITGLFDK